MNKDIVITLGLPLLIFILMMGFAGLMRLYFEYIEQQKSFVRIRVNR